MRVSTLNWELSANNLEQIKNRNVFFTQWVINQWNSFPQEMVMASGLGVVKRGLVRFLEVKSIAGYRPGWVVQHLYFRNRSP